MKLGLVQTTTKITSPEFSGEFYLATESDGGLVVLHSDGGQELSLVSIHPPKDKKIRVYVYYNGSWDGEAYSTPTTNQLATISMAELLGEIRRRITDGDGTREDE